jgi:hypothetical protein
MLRLCAAVLCQPADLCDVESDITPMRWRVARVVHKSLGVDPADLPIETRFMVSVATRSSSHQTPCTAVNLDWLLHIKWHVPACLLACLSGPVAYPTVCWLHHALRCVQVQSICRLVARRSARLAACLLVAVLRLQNWMEYPRRLVVAVDGGVFLKYNNWRKFLRQYLCEAFGKACLGHCTCSTGYPPIQ